MALIPYPDPENLSKEARDVLAVAPQNIARMLSGSGALFLPLMGFAKAFFTHGTLSPALRELVTCRIGHRYDARYVLDQHELMARSAGVTEKQMEAVRGLLPSPEFSEHDNAALMLADAMADHPRAPEELVLRAYELMGETALHELLLVSGFYHLAARYTETLRIDLDAKGNAIDSVNALGKMSARKT